MSNVVHFPGNETEARFTVLKEYPAIGDGSSVAVAKGSSNGVDTLAVVLLMGPEDADEPFAILAEFRADFGGDVLSAVTQIADIAATTLSSYTERLRIA